MEWILVLYFAFNTGGFKVGGGGGVALDHIEFHTEQQCEAAGRRILHEFNSINGQTDVYTARKVNNRRYICIHRGSQNTMVNTKARATDK